MITGTPPGPPSAAAGLTSAAQARRASTQSCSRAPPDSEANGTVVPRSVRLAEAPSYGRPIALYSPTSRGAQAYSDLAAELLARDGRAAAAAMATGAPAWVTR